MSFFNSIENEVAKIFGDVKKAEQVVVLEIGKFKSYIAAHPSLEADLQKVFGKAGDLFKTAIQDAMATAEKDAASGKSVVNVVTDVYNAIHGAVPGVASQLVADVTNSQNAWTIALQAATAIASAVTAAPSA